MKRIAGLTLALTGLAAGLIVFAVSRSTPVSAEPLENFCICHATQQNKVEGNTSQDPNPNQKYILICPNGNSQKPANLRGHGGHPDDVIVPVGEECPLET